LRQQSKVQTMYNHNTKKTNYTQRKSLTIAELLSMIVTHNGSGVKQCGSSYRVNCPAHSDSRPSMSIKESNNGFILLYCHTGCTTQEICDVLGIHISQLFPQKNIGAYNE
jgi:hypothetical protein